MRRWWPLAATVAGAALWLAWRARSPASLSGEVALVTGGSRGLGYLLAERLLAQGCRVAICARDPEPLERARRKLEERTGADVLAVRCDVSDREAVDAMVASVNERIGPIDLLVNNASIIQVAPLESLDVDDFLRAVDINFMGAVHTTLAVLPGMRDRGRGRIANITSIGGKIAPPHILPYACAKFAMVGFSEGLRASLAKDGITVTTVVPGLMRTGSPVHVDYGGRASREFAWFALSDLLPVTSISAERAADRIVRSIRRGEAEVTLSWQAKLVRLVQGVAPGGVSRVLGVVNRVLPEPDGEREARGTELRGTLPGWAERALDRAGARTNQGAGAT